MLWGGRRVTGHPAVRPNRRTSSSCDYQSRASHDVGDITKLRGRTREKA